MTMSRPVFTLSEAARRTGVSRSTMRRYREAGEFPNAYKNTDKVWMIPVEDLLAKGLKPQGEASGVVTLSDPAQDTPQAGPVSTPTGVSEEVLSLRQELAVERARREGVENVLEEVRRRADLAEMALRQIEAPKTVDDAVKQMAEHGIHVGQGAAPEGATQETAPKRRWWQW